MRSLVDYSRSLIGVEYSESGIPLGMISWATIEDHCIVVRIKPGKCCGDPFEAVVDEICLRDNWPYGPILHPILEMSLVEEVTDDGRSQEHQNSDYGVPQRHQV